MNVADYLVKELVNLGVSEAFGMPGGVVLEFIYALDRNDKINAHLSYHEQCAGFAAYGYAKLSNKIGVVYVTKGPGLTNIVTSIADAYYDSIPLLIITAHSFKINNTKMRCEFDQEIDSISLVKNMTKYVARVEDITSVRSEIIKAIYNATTGRKGPVLLDFKSSLFNENADKLNDIIWSDEFLISEFKSIEPEIIKNLSQALKNAKRPVLLIGSGIKQHNLSEYTRRLVDSLKIPVLSSRYAQDLLINSQFYFGYIGSHGIRYSNFILAKADLIISIGNRMAFPLNSLTYQKLIKDKKFIRFDIDKAEFERKIPNSSDYYIDLNLLLPNLLKNFNIVSHYDEWLSVCRTIKEELYNYDINLPVNKIIEILKYFKNIKNIVCDVGNNEFWVSRGLEYIKLKKTIVFSQSFGVLGSAIPKAIGMYYAQRKPVMCFIGDQGFQMNLQELECIVKNKLPIVIIVLNNFSSGMIKDREKNLGYKYYVQTTLNSGYSVPDIKKLTLAYGIKYYNWNDKEYIDKNIFEPAIIEVNFNDSYSLEQHLPLGNDFQNLEPRLTKLKYTYLNSL